MTYLYIYLITEYFVVQKAIASYTELLDERLENSTFIILVVGLLVALTGVYIPSASANTNYMKSSVVQHSQSIETQNTILIDGQEYIIYITKK